MATILKHLGAPKNFITLVSFIAAAYGQEGWLDVLETFSGCQSVVRAAHADGLRAVGFIRALLARRHLEEEGYTVTDTTQPQDELAYATVYIYIYT